jgi:hypothetical protein
MPRILSTRIAYSTIFGSPRMSERTWRRIVGSEKSGTTAYEYWEASSTHLTNERDFPYPRAGGARTASKCQD